MWLLGRINSVPTAIDITNFTLLCFTLRVPHIFIFQKNKDILIPQVLTTFAFIDNPNYQLGGSSSSPIYQGWYTRTRTEKSYNILFCHWCMMRVSFGNHFLLRNAHPSPHCFEHHFYFLNNLTNIGFPLVLVNYSECNTNKWYIDLYHKLTIFLF